MSVVSLKYNHPGATLRDRVSYSITHLLIYYHSVHHVLKTLLTKAPVYLYDKLTKDGEYNCDRRHARNSSITLGPSFQTKLSLYMNSFRWRGAEWYEALPQDIRGELKIGKLQWKVNSWIKTNIMI